LAPNHTQKLRTLFERWSGEEPETLEALPQSGSYRRYYRLHGKHTTAVGVYNQDLQENRAFVGMTKHFAKFGIPVPALHAENEAGDSYLIDDLGDATLFHLLTERREATGVFPGTVIDLYKQALTTLPQIQITASKTMDYSICYPRSAFDRQSMMWDLNYFKYYFLKLAKVPFDEQHLENDYQILCDFLLDADQDYFLYRDFQSSNIMVQNNALFFIDYQGGRKGALQYDVASLLWDSKAAIPFEVKQVLLDHYLQVVGSSYGIDPEKFMEKYSAFVLIRLMQALGAYGFRGLYERKTRFLQSIPFALRQMDYLIHKTSIPVKIPHLLSVLSGMKESTELIRYVQRFSFSRPLTIDIFSFSYTKMIPQNNYGHGGGFVFDCRCLQNPGNYGKYAQMDGNSPAVIEFLGESGEADSFLHLVFQLVDQAIEKYLSREFANLQVCFGGTLGMYRPVFCAEKLKSYLAEKYPEEVRVLVVHQELKNPDK
jgi:aminoglycoside/choline kinase family phosphotransferase